MGDHVDVKGASAEGKDCNAFLVAAIDFGTTYSGWAFSFNHEFTKDPCKVSAKVWTGGDQVSLKGPSCILLEKKGKDVKFVAFGYEAESRYTEIIYEEIEGDFYFFKRFKMLLFGKVGVQKNIMIDDVTGKKKLPALTVFRMAIEYLKNDLLDMSRARIAGGGIKESDVKWVITVPAIWNDAAKQFMREAAKEAGISPERIAIALEPEAASLYCRHVPMEKVEEASQNALATLKAGTKYLILDAGGGTVDITVHEVMPNGQLRELHQASGGAWGGTTIDEQYINFMTKLIDPDVMKKLRDEHIEDYIDLLRDFEVKKRTIVPDKTSKITIRLPSLVHDLYEDEKDEKLSKAVKKSALADSVGLSGDKLRIDPDIARGFFKKTNENIVKHIKELLQKPHVKGSKCILLVGGFSESKMVEAAVRSAFPNMDISVPPEAGLAVLKGAVIFGHSPTTVAERVCRHTYGVATRLLFKEGVHPESKKIVVDGEERVKDVFDVHVKAGQVVKLGEAQTEQGYTPAKADQTSIGFTLYATEDPDPKFVTDPGCTKIGKFSVPIPDTSKGKKRSIKVRMIFGGTEVEVEGLEKDTGQITKATLDFLG